MFLTHRSAADLVAGHYLKNVTSFFSDKVALVKFLLPLASEIGWFGGCGQFVCTGKSNQLIYDSDGLFTNYSGPNNLIAKNDMFAVSLGSACTSIDSWEGYECHGNIMANLVFDSTAADRQSRLYSPVYLNISGTGTNMLNSYKEWGWAGPEPLNTRLSQFIGHV